MDKRFHFSETIYPQFPFPISAGEIAALKDTRLLTEDNLLPAGITGSSPLAKLPYALIWNNGNLGKLQHIVAGQTMAQTGADRGVAAGYRPCLHGNKVLFAPGK